MVMGPTCGLVLADLGAEVIKVEPVEGDRTRHLLGAGAGFFRCSTATSKALALTCATPAGWKWRCDWRARPMWWCRTSSLA